VHIVTFLTHGFYPFLWWISEREFVYFLIYVTQKITAPFDWCTCQVHIEDFVCV